MHVAQLLHPLPRRPHVEIVEARLPKRSLRFLSEQRPLPRITAPSLRQQRPCRTLLHHLHHRRRSSHLGLGHQNMNMLRHHHIADDYKTVALSRLFENGEEPVASLGRTEKRQSPIARPGDKVQMVRTVSAMQAAGHEQPMLSAVSYPPLQKSQGRGTHSFKVGHRKPMRKAGPPVLQFREGI